MRTGLLAKKVGMTRLFQEKGGHIPVTVLQVDNLQVVAHKTDEKDGYNAMQLGFGAAKVKNVSKAMRGHFAKSKVEPRERWLIDTPCDALRPPKPWRFMPPAKPLPMLVPQTSTICPSRKWPTESSDPTSTKLSADTRNSVSLRFGSTGQCQDPGKVFKGKKMAGQMGSVRVTTQNLEIVGTDEARGLLLVRGAVPGSKGSYVRVTDAVKKALPDGVPLPAGLKQDDTPEAPESVEPAEAQGTDAEATEAETTAAQAEPAAEEAPEAESAADTADDGEKKE